MFTLWELFNVCLGKYFGDLQKLMWFMWRFIFIFMRTTSSTKLSSFEMTSIWDKLCLQIPSAVCGWWCEIYDKRSWIEVSHRWIPSYISCLSRMSRLVSMRNVKMRNIKNSQSWKEKVFGVEISWYDIICLYEALKYTNTKVRAIEKW